jgi:hypothetical protein
VKKNILIVILGAGVVLSVLLVIRFVFGGPEDDWICQNGAWVKHGSPSKPMPKEGCQAKISPKPGEFANGQKYKVYSDENFEIHYPDWPIIDQKNILDPTAVVGVTNEGCNFVINKNEVPTTKSFKEHTEAKLAEQISKLNIAMSIKEVTDNSSYIEGTLQINEATLYNVSYGFYIKEANKSYGVGFIAQESKFEQVCRPLITEVIASVKIK